MHLITGKAVLADNYIFVSQGLHNNAKKKKYNNGKKALTLAHVIEVQPQYPYGPPCPLNPLTGPGSSQASTGRYGWWFGSDGGGCWDWWGEKVQEG